VCHVFIHRSGASASRSSEGTAEWFPDRPDRWAYEWQYAPCKGCTALEPQRDWLRMQQLAGLKKVHFLRTPDNRWGDAYSFAPNALVLSDAALRLPRCQLNFVIGHELVHLAMHDSDEDARSAAVLSGYRPDWTRNGIRALSLLDGDFRLTLLMSSIWQSQERRADWVGALLAAQGSGCTLQEGALAYLAMNQAGFGGGLGAEHEANAKRVHDLAGFAEPVMRLAERL